MKITFISLDHSAHRAVQARFRGIPFHETLEMHGVTLEAHQGPVEEWLPVHRPTAIITPGNSYGHMTGGFDGALVNVFGSSLDTCIRHMVVRDFMGELPVGQALRFCANYGTGIDPLPIILYAPTMRVPRGLEPDSDVPYVATLAALQQLKEVFPARRTAHLLTPLMGHATGGLDTLLIARQMQLAFMRFLDPRPVRHLFADGDALDKIIRGIPIDVNVADYITRT